MRGNGARALQEEKTLLQELSKLFHVARANAREQRIIKRAATSREGDGKPKNAVSSARQKPGLKAGHKANKCTSRARKSKNGGTVWVVLKGGLAQVPTSGMTGVIAHNTEFRGRLSERRRLEALETAEVYVQTAWQQAQEAGLLLPDGSAPSGDEGLLYLREQYHVASGMLRREPVGQHLKQLVECSIPTTFKNDEVPFSSTSGATVYDKDTWADIITRENVILKRFNSRLSGVDSTDQILNEAENVASKFYFPVAEPLAPVGSTAAQSTNSSNSIEVLHGEQVRDIVPTKCIVRIRGSNGKKHTTILSTAKSVNSFKTNFMKIIRKEVSGSMLSRGAEAVEERQRQGGATPDNAAGSVPRKRGNKKRK
ncbi:hypothetical protein ERJ75_001330300 [Trypanosoma vivax]|uniref:Uncharacterized protein n=1 Tax=Trypanosoma vivax (strain Y486) TaxID=1055687 RepID=G0TRP1_TRYVY|nr:hypothetical protein TRVL_06189 [Trypanosoma vivax]KAH8608114.1 hypothetical protein ERJ75_001330300 [Trypanosoma vivax]CCC46612.1 conserved hypothetical protein [Trypanosoma vivax Y486]